MNIKFLSLKEMLSERFYPIVVLAGEDAYLRRKALEMLYDSSDILLPELNYIIYNEEITLKQALSVCRALPFGGTRKLVVMDLSAAEKLYFADSERKEFDSYYENPSEWCCLVILAAVSHELFARDMILTVDCSRPDRAHCVKWIKGKFARLGRLITNDAAEKVAEYCLYDMTRISNETEKLAAYGMDIDVDTVEMMVSKDIEFRVYELADCIASGQGDRALEIMDCMLREKEEPTALLALIYSYYRRLYYISVSKGMTVADLAKMLGVKPYAVQKASSIQKKYGSAKLARALSLFEKAESEIKMTWGRDRSYLELVVMNLLNL